MREWAAVPVDQLTMKIAHFTSELSGGAGVAAQRLNDALQQQGVDSRLYYQSGLPLVPGCQRVFENQSFTWRNLAALARAWRNRRNAPGCLVTSPRWIRRTRLQDFGPRPDVVNLHWISRWIDQPSFFASLPMDLPVVWSLHDMNPFTGGCHHAGDCERFTTHCRECPQLKSPGPHDDAFRFFEIKKGCYAGKNLHVVSSSDWMNLQARRSALLRHATSFHTIPLGLDTQSFNPIDKSCARQALAIDSERFVVGFACADLSSNDKGGPLLVEALHALSNKAKVTLLVFGVGELPDSGGRSEPDGRYQLIELGTINSPRLQSLFYSACDVFAAPSRIESFGLTALEAMACGTPVVAFNTGGLVDVVADGETGLLETKVRSVVGLRDQLDWMLQHPTERQNMGLAARQRVEKQFASTLMARRYVELYNRLLGTNE
jgi:glycosyltransferase involved in cell wall biosynthesis